MALESKGSGNSQDSLLIQVVDWSYKIESPMNNRLFGHERRHSAGVEDVEEQRLDHIFFMMS